MRRFYGKREILEKYISSLYNKPKLSSMNKSPLEQLIWHQNSTQKKKKINFEKKKDIWWWWEKIISNLKEKENYDDDEEK